MTINKLVDLITVLTPLLVALLTLLAAYLGYKWTKRTALKTALISSDYIKLSTIFENATTALYILTLDSQYIGLRQAGQTDVSRKNADHARFLLRQAEADAGIHLTESTKTLIGQAKQLADRFVSNPSPNEDISGKLKDIKRKLDSAFKRERERLENG